MGRVGFLPWLPRERTNASTLSPFAVPSAVATRIRLAYSCPKRALVTLAPATGAREGRGGRGDSSRLDGRIRISKIREELWALTRVEVGRRKGETRELRIEMDGAGQTPSLSFPLINLRLPCSSLPFFFFFFFFFFFWLLTSCSIFVFRLYLRPRHFATLTPLSLSFYSSRLYFTAPSSGCISVLSGKSLFTFAPRKIVPTFPLESISPPGRCD